MNVEKMLYHRNQDLEKKVLSRIISTGKMPIGLIDGYFQGKERCLFAELTKQWVEHGQIDIGALRDEHFVLLDELISLDGTYSDVAIEDLHKSWMVRETGMVIHQQKDSPYDYIKDLQEKLGNIVLKKCDEKYVHQDIINELLEQKEIAQKNEKKILGYSTGLSLFDETLNGIEPGKFYVLGALKKTGKSRFMTYLAIKCCEDSAGVLINSLEMNRLQLSYLAMSYYSSINSRRIAGCLNQREMTQFAAAMGKFNNLNWLIYRDYQIADLRSRILHERQKRPVNVVIVDFIQRMRPSQFKSDRVRGVEEISIGLADLSRELNVAVVCLAQLSKEAERLGENELPNMSHFKESQGIVENADTIIVMHDTKRGENPYGGYDGAYVLPKFKFKIDQRYDFSGKVIDIDGDLRICNFVEPSESM